MTAARRPLGGNFHRFWLAAAASNLGDGIRVGALPLLALRLTDNTTLVGAVTAATIAPWAFAPMAGVFADRADRRRLMMIGQFARAVLVGLLVALVLADALSIGVLLAVAIGLGCGEVIVDTCSQAAVPHLVAPDQLDTANSRLASATQVLDEVVGVALGAALFAFATSLPFVIDAATFVVGGVVLATLRHPLQGEPPSRAGVFAELAEGFRFLRGNGFLRNSMLAAATSNMATNMAFAVLVVLVVRELDQPEAVYGVVVAVSSVGGVLAALVAARLVAAVGRRRLLVAAPIVMTAGLVIAAGAPHVAFVAVTWFVIRFAIIALGVPVVSLRQAITPAHLLGRVVATFRMVGMGAAPLGALFGGLLTQLADVRTTNLTAAALMLGAVAFLANAVRHLPAAHAARAPTGEPAGALENG